MSPYYQQDGITIYHGDCREVLSALTVTVELVLTDPPYGVSQPGVAHFGPRNGSRNFDFFPDDTAENSTALCLAAAELSMPLLSKSASVYWWCGHRQFGRLADWYAAQGWQSRFLVWEKDCPCPPPPGAGWPSGAELCLYAWRPGRTWNHNGKNFPRSNVLNADSYRFGQPGKVDHPTQKPLSICWPLIVASSTVGQTILDPFMGSGTTLRAAKDWRRKAIGIETEEKYCEIAAKRMSQAVFEFESA